MDLDIVAGVGPVVARPIRERSDLEQLVDLTRDHVPSQRPSDSWSPSSARPRSSGSPGRRSPWRPTSSRWAVEEPRAHQGLDARRPELWDALCSRLAQISGAFLRVQAEAGASAVQLFDSWVGALSRADYVRHVQRHSAAALDAVTDLDVPRIHFGVGTGELLRLMGEAGAEVVGVDYRVSLADAVERLGPGHAVQGNLDPALLFAPWEAIERRVREIVDEGRRAPGPIFNLGHGVPPAVDPDVLTRVTALVHEVSTR